MGSKQAIDNPPQKIPLNLLERFTGRLVIRQAQGFYSSRLTTKVKIS